MGEDAPKKRANAHRRDRQNDKKVYERDDISPEEKEGDKVRLEIEEAGKPDPENQRATAHSQAA